MTRYIWQERELMIKSPCAFNVYFNKRDKNIKISYNVARDCVQGSSEKKEYACLYWVFKGLLKRGKLRGWRDDSAVQSPCCSCMESRFSSQHQFITTLNSSSNQTPSSGSMVPLQAKHTKIKKSWSEGSRRGEFGHASHWLAYMKDGRQDGTRTFCLISLYNILLLM